MEYLTLDAAFDWVYLVVSPQSPFKGAENALTGEERYRAAVEAVKRHPEIRVWVDDIELGMEPPHYTIRTLDALRAREPENEFTLVIGADNLESFPRWREHERILKEYGVAVFPRKGFHRGYLKARLMRECPRTVDKGGHYKSQPITWFGNTGEYLHAGHSQYDTYGRRVVQYPK